MKALLHRLFTPEIPTLPPNVAARISAFLAGFAFCFGIVGVLNKQIAASVPVLFFLSVYAIVRAEMIAAQQYRELAERLDQPPEEKVVKALVEQTGIERSAE